MDLVPPGFRYMEDMMGYYLGVVVGILMCFVVMFAIYMNDYKDGQIDAINGDIKYELVVQKDNSTKWERIKDYENKN